MWVFIFWAGEFHAECNVQNVKSIFKYKILVFFKWLKKNSGFWNQFNENNEKNDFYSRLEIKLAFTGVGVSPIPIPLDQTFMHVDLMPIFISNTIRVYGIWIIVQHTYMVRSEIFSTVNNGKNTRNTFLFL